MDIIFANQVLLKYPAGNYSLAKAQRRGALILFLRPQTSPPCHVIYDWEKPMVSLVNITYKKSYPKREKSESKFESFFSIVGFLSELKRSCAKNNNINFIELCLYFINYTIIF